MLPLEWLLCIYSAPMILGYNEEKAAVYMWILIIYSYNDQNVHLFLLLYFQETWTLFFLQAQLFDIISYLWANVANTVEYQ